MRVGTRSILYGAHAFWLHPFFVAAGWWKLYGIPLDPRLWCAFFLHDAGYFRKPNMDGVEGETHPELGARIMRLMFGDAWGDFCLLHSRYYAKKLNRPYSKLCAADKLATAMTPAWLYLPMVRATGEIAEYMSRAATMAKYSRSLNPQELAQVTSDNQRAWFAGVQSHMRRWAMEHVDGRPDLWTRSDRQANHLGVYA